MVPAMYALIQMGEGNNISVALSGSMLIPQPSCLKFM